MRSSRQLRKLGMSEEGTAWVTVDKTCSACGGVLRCPKLVTSSQVEFF
jgi:hypothetical protein